MAFLLHGVVCQVRNVQQLVVSVVLRSCKSERTEFDAAWVTMSRFRGPSLAGNLVKL